MKLKFQITPILFLLCGLSFISCSKDDAEGTINIELPDLLSIDENKMSYTKGETIWLNVDIPNIMIDAQGRERNIKVLSGAQTALTNIKVFKETGFSLPSQIRLSKDDFIVEKGQMELFPFETLMRTRASFQNDSFQFRFGIKLAEAGDYFISTPSGEGDFETFFDVGNNNIDFNLKTTLRGGDANNRFLFTVTE